MTTHERFTQFLDTKKIYNLDHLHLDGSVLPLISKPVWSLAHSNADGSPALSIATLETSPDGQSARITAEMLGTVEVTVTAAVSPTAVATKTFHINIAVHPPVTAGAPTFTISQHRDRPIN